MDSAKFLGITDKHSTFSLFPTPEGYSKWSYQYQWFNSGATERGG